MSVFDWCQHGRHEECRRSYRPFIIDPRTNAVIESDEDKVCECTKRGCKCYTKPEHRTKKRKTRRKK